MSWLLRFSKPRPISSSGRARVGIWDGCGDGKGFGGTVGNHFCAPPMRPLHPCQPLCVCFFSALVFLAAQIHGRELASRLFPSRCLAVTCPGWRVVQPFVKMTDKHLFFLGGGGGDKVSVTFLLWVVLHSGLIFSEVPTQGFWVVGYGLCVCWLFQGRKRQQAQRYDAPSSSGLNFFMCLTGEMEVSFGYIFTFWNLALALPCVQLGSCRRGSFVPRKIMDPLIFEVVEFLWRTPAVVVYFLSSLRSFIPLFSVHVFLEADTDQFSVRLFTARPHVFFAMGWKHSSYILVAVVVCAFDWYWWTIGDVDPICAVLSVVVCSWARTGV